MLYLCRWVLSLIFELSGDLPQLHSFPTRRSSDLHPSQLYEALCEGLLLFLLLLVAERRGVRHRPGIVSGLFLIDRKSTRLNSSHVSISYAVFCLKKKKGCLGKFEFH